MTLSDHDHFVGFCVVAALYWLAFLLSVTPHNDQGIYREDEAGRRTRRITRTHVSLVYLLGAFTYSATAMIFVTHLDDLLGITHVSALITHSVSLTWNFVTILLALNWSDGFAKEKLVGPWIGALCFLAVSALFVCFVGQYPGPAAQNYIVAGSGTAFGAAYLLIYVVAIVLTKIVLIRVCAPHVRTSTDRASRISLSVAITGSALLMLFGFARSANLVIGHWGLSAQAWEPVPFTLLIFGASLLAIGFSLPRAWSLCRGAGQWCSYYAVHRTIAPLAAASWQLHPALRPADAFTVWGSLELLRPTRLKMQVHRELITIMDSALGAIKAGEPRAAGDAPPAEPGLPEKLSARAGHLDRFESIIAISKRYNSLVACGLAREDAYRRAASLFPQSVQTGAPSPK